MDFVEAVGLKSTEIGILSWATAQIGRQTRQLYSPVSVEGRSGDIEIVLVPEVHVEELYTSLVSLDGQGRAEAYTFTDRALKLGYYPAGQPVKIPLPTLKGKGIYRLEISGLVKGGGSITRDMYFVNRQN